VKLNCITCLPPCFYKRSVFKRVFVVLGMDNNLINEVKKKKVLSGLPDELVWRFLEKNNLDKKSTRADLRKFFGVFLTNRVLRGVGEDVLGSHISSRGRDYEEFHEKIFEGVDKIKSVVDLGCGVNGFSYSYLKKMFGDLSYFGVEASGQLVDIMNNYFASNNFTGAKSFCLDISDAESVFRLIKDAKSPRGILILQVIDALESLEKDLSKKFLINLKEHLSEKDWAIITMPMSSISGRKTFEVDRKWLRDFLNSEFDLVDEFVLGNERVFRIKIK